MKQMDLSSVFSYNCEVYFEKSVDVGGYSYLVIFGHHINGGFIAIPNWQVSCEASDHINSKRYNIEKMKSAGIDSDVAEAIAGYIDGYIMEKENERTKESSDLSLHRPLSKKALCL